MKKYITLSGVNKICENLGLPRLSLPDWWMVRSKHKPDRLSWEQYLNLVRTLDANGFTYRTNIPGYLQ